MRERRSPTSQDAPVGRTEDIQALLASWLHNRSPHSARAYTANIARFLAHVDKPLTAVTRADLQDYADSLAGAGIAPASQARMLAAVKSLLTFAHTTGYLPYNPGRGPRLPGVRGRLAERISSEEDVLSLLARESTRRNHALIRLLYAVSLRLSDVCTLRWRDVQARGKSGQVTVWGTGEKERAVLLTERTWRELIALRSESARPDAPVFRSRHDRPRSPTQAWRVVKAAAERAGLDKAAEFSPHWLRHAHVRHALDRGAPISLVRDGLGHVSLVTTSRYTHARPGDGSGRYLLM